MLTVVNLFVGNIGDFDLSASGTRCGSWEGGAVEGIDI